MTVSTGNWTVNKLGTMTISSTANVALTSPTTADYDKNQGFGAPVPKVEQITNTRTATISANAPWTLSVSPNTAGSPSYWIGVNDPTYGTFVPAETNKPSSEFMVGTAFSTTGTGYLALPSSNSGSTPLLSNQVPVSGRVVTLYWGTVWSYAYDGPGTYTLPFKVVLTIP